MKCIKQTFLVALLICLVVSPAFCGWDAFKRPSLEFSTESSVGSEEVTTAQDQDQSQEQSSETSPSEATVASQMTKDALTNLEDNSGNYDQKLAEAKEAIAEAEVEVDALAETEKPKKVEEKRTAVEEAKAIVDELVVSKAKLDEDHEILTDIVVAQQKVIEKQDRQLDGLNFGLGGMYNQTIKFDEQGMDALSILNPSVLFGMRYRHWEFLLGLGATFDFSNGFTNAFKQMDQMTISVGGVYWF